MAQPAARDVSPEWIETMLAADPRVAQCAVVADGEAKLAIVLIPSPIGEEWFAKASPAEVADLIRRSCSEAPEHALPGRRVVLSLPEAIDAQALTPNGRIRRERVESLMRARSQTANAWSPTLF